MKHQCNDCVFYKQTIEYGQWQNYHCTYKSEFSSGSPDSDYYNQASSERCSHRKESL